MIFTILGILAVILGVAAIILLIIAITQGKIKFGKNTAWIIVVILIFIGAWAGYKYWWLESTPTAKNWKISWEKAPDYHGKTDRRQITLPAKIKSKEKEILVIFYLCPDGNTGTMQGVSADGISYNGTWYDVSGRGNFHLRFSSETTAFGWWDDDGNGQKQPMVIEQI